MSCRCSCPSRGPEAPEVLSPLYNGFCDIWALRWPGVRFYCESGLGAFPCILVPDMRFEVFFTVHCSS